jgi:hypothetical protein
MCYWHEIAYFKEFKLDLNNIVISGYNPKSLLI